MVNIKKSIRKFVAVSSACTLVLYPQMFVYAKNDDVNIQANISPKENMTSDLNITKKEFDELLQDNVVCENEQTCSEIEVENDTSVTQPILEKEVFVPPETDCVGYCSGDAGVKIMLNADINSDCIGCIVSSDVDVKLNYAVIDDLWVYIEYQEISGFVLKNQIRNFKYITETAEYTDYFITFDNGFKSYMDYRKITDKSSRQWDYQQFAVTDEETGIRKINDRYCIALGTGFNAPVGTEVDVNLENGNIIQCIVSEVKSDKDTDALNLYHLSDGSVIEFIVDENMVKTEVKAAGSLSKVSPEFKSKIISIRKYFLEAITFEVELEKIKDAGINVQEIFLPEKNISEIKG